jgi:hypothetical protein
MNTYSVLRGKNVTQQRHCTQNLKQIFLEMKLCGLVPNFHIYASVSDLYIPTIGVPIEYGNWEQGRAASFLGIHESDLLRSANVKRTWYR